MADKIPEIIDLVFDLDGAMLPVTYPFALWAALTGIVPRLADEKFVGILPLRGTIGSAGLLLPKRAKLVIRLPEALADDVAARLTGQQLEICGHTVRLGTVKRRQIHAHPTVHSELVEGDNDEVRFLESTHRKLGEMTIKGKLICGRRRSISDEQRSIHGYSLVVHDLKPEASLHLQFVGLGEGRRFGCGIFVPSKVISGLGDD